MRLCIVQQGAVESASLTTVEKGTKEYDKGGTFMELKRVDWSVDQSSQFPDRDEDLLASLQLLANGDSTNFTEKLNRLINRAELAVKFPLMSYEQLELELFTNVTDACKQQKYWTAKRAVEGVRIVFKDPFACVPVIEPPRKRSKLDETQPSSLPATCSVDAKAGMDSNDPHGDEHENAPLSSNDVLSSLAYGEWAGSISFIEWRGEVALHVVGDLPLVMVGQQARQLALVVMQRHSDVTAAGAKYVHDDEKLFDEFVGWTTPDGKKPISPRLHFARDHSICSVFLSRSSLAMRQEYTLTTKEISGGLQLQSFPIPLAHASTETLRTVLELCGRSLIFHALLVSAFYSRNNVFGERIAADNDDVMHGTILLTCLGDVGMWKKLMVFRVATARIKVDVAPVERITMNTGDLLGPDKHVLLELSTKPDCSLELSVKYQNETMPAPPLENAATLEQLVRVCHSIPLLTYFALKRTIESKNGSATTAEAAGEDCNGIAALDGDLAVSMKMEGEGMLLDEMDMF
ncbi:hypothetical protein PsorP6_009628 [Peronosclerospora sorghi]|uniref:Uncharacterized protein n=1 Tax=Peronosclerospora sorghi TaxID=230839 RepID=A0ACC0W0T4_9STRA|nr:hypothetical protein PsorP6_009628 [Peronosclerospora sorghi]